MPSYKTTSKSKRAVIYPVRDAPCPVKTKIGDPMKGSALYRFRGGNRALPTSWATDDGYTLADLADASDAPNDLKNKFRNRRFKSTETMLRMLENDLGIRAYTTEDGIIARVSGSSTQDGFDYEDWKKGRTYRFAEVDDPSGKTSRNLYVPDESAIPGKVLRRDDRTFYSITEAEMEAADFGIANAPKSEWRFRVGLKGSGTNLSLADVSKIGYDGREMRIGDRMTVGPLVIERIRPQAKDYFSERGSVTYGQSANRKRANTKPKSGQKQSCGSCKGKSCKGGQCRSDCGSCNRKTKPAKNNPTAKRRC